MLSREAKYVYDTFVWYYDRKYILMPFFVYTEGEQPIKPWIFSFRGQRDSFMDLTIDQYANSIQELVKSGLFKLTKSRLAVEICSPVDIIRHKNEKHD